MEVQGRKERDQQREPADWVDTAVVNTASLHKPRRRQEEIETAVGRGLRARSARGGTGPRTLTHQERGFEARTEKRRRRSIRRSDTGKASPGTIHKRNTRAEESQVPTTQDGKVQ